MFQKIYNFAPDFRTKLFMGYLRKVSSLLRKALLVGWALAVIWIYLGNLVNFHLNRIWGKQLMPIECSSTRVKEKDAASFVKNNRYSKSIDSGLQFDFTITSNQISEILYTGLVSSHLDLSDIPLFCQGIQAFSFRGPPSA
jgi:hypothetical protein